MATVRITMTKANAEEPTILSQITLMRRANTFQPVVTRVWL